MMYHWLDYKSIKTLLQSIKKSETFKNFSNFHMYSTQNNGWHIAKGGKSQLLGWVSVSPRLYVPWENVSHYYKQSIKCMLSVMQGKQSTWQQNTTADLPLTDCTLSNA